MEFMTENVEETFGKTDLQKELEWIWATDERSRKRIVEAKIFLWMKR